jgi:hypothetical protein
LLTPEESRGDLLYGPVTEPIVSASFNGDFAELTAHRFFFGMELNMIQLLSPSYGALDLSDQFFGSASYPDPPQLNLGPRETRVVSASIPSSYFPALSLGSLGYWIMLTDTADGMFAMDYLSLRIETALRTIEVFVDSSSNNGYGIGVADNGMLPASVFDSLPPESTGTGFDETISGKGIHSEVPEPGTYLLTGTVLVLCAALIRRGRRRSVDVSVVLLAVGIAGAQTPVINEVLYMPDPASSDPAVQQEFVEIVNKTSTGISLGGYVLADRDGRPGAAARALPSITLPPGAYLAVHIGAGVNDFDFSDGGGHYYTNDPSGADLFGDAMDDVALYSSSAIVDYLAWNESETGYLPAAAHNDAVSASIWQNGAFLEAGHIANSPEEKYRTVEAGASLTRDESAADGNGTSDFDVRAPGATPGANNARREFLVASAETRAPRVRSWTLMFYMSNDHNEDYWSFQDIKKLERALDPAGNFNLVVMTDTKRNLQQARLAADGSLTPIGLAGRAWRFRVGPEQDRRYINMIHHAAQDPSLGEVDMGDPATLSAFIRWAAATYPANRYGLVIATHGSGWKGVGCDHTNVGAGPDFDCLYMDEISTALAAGGLNFEFIGFDACMMGMIEVATQVAPYARYLVASEETEPGSGWPHDEWVRDAPDGDVLTKRIVNTYGAFQRNNRDHTLSSIDLRNLPQLLRVVSDFAVDLRRAVDDFRMHDLIVDNVQVALYDDAQLAARFSDRNYMDLRHFAQLVLADARIPACYKAQIPALLALTAPGGPVIIAERHGPQRPNATGLSIHLPLKRTYRAYFGDVFTNHTCGGVSRDTALRVAAGAGAPVAEALEYLHDQPYDYPCFSRLTDWGSQRVLYAENNDKLPLQARDIEFGIPLLAPLRWPLISTAGFTFPTTTQWDEFLLRFYHPTSDNRIVAITDLRGNRTEIQTPPPACGNPTDKVTIEPGWKVEFSGQGSSDIDLFVPLTPTRRARVQRAMHWMWDFNDKANGCAMCKAPYEVGNGVDAATANDDMNGDHDADKRPLDDEKEANAQLTERAFPALGTYVITLHAWDDNHTFQFHDTNPTDKYVHPQTDDHPSIVEVVPPPVTQIHNYGPFPNRFRPGESGSFTASAQNGTTPVPGVMMRFTKMAGNFTFTAGQVSADGKQSAVVSNDQGQAVMSFRANAPGPALIKVTVDGVGVAASTIFFVQ